MLPLSTTMQINAITSGATGVGLVLFASPIAALFGVEPTSPFIAVGVFLVLFASFVFQVSRKKPINAGAVRVVILLDTLWVIASIIALAFLSSIISLIGVISIAAVACWVAAMAYLQNKGLSTYSFK